MLTFTLTSVRNTLTANANLYSVENGHIYVSNNTSRDLKLDGAERHFQLFTFSIRINEEMCENSTKQQSHIYLIELTNKPKLNKFKYLTRNQLTTTIR